MDILDNNRLISVPIFYCLSVQPKRTNPKIPAGSEAHVGDEVCNFLRARIRSFEFHQRKIKDDSVNNCP